MTEQKPRIAKPKPVQKTDGGVVEFASEVMERTGGAVLAVLFATVALPAALMIGSVAALVDRGRVKTHLELYRGPDVAKE